MPFITNSFQEMHKSELAQLISSMFTEHVSELEDESTNLQTDVAWKQRVNDTTSRT